MKNEDKVLKQTQELITARKNEYWQYFCNHKKLWGHGVTLKKLEKIKQTIWNDGAFWSDILFRHSGLERSPKEYKDAQPASFVHCIGNFSSMIYETLFRQGSVK